MCLLFGGSCLCSKKQEWFKLDENNNTQLNCVIKPMQYETYNASSFVSAVNGKNILSHVAVNPSLDNSINFKPGIFRLDVEKYYLNLNDPTYSQFTISIYNTYDKKHAPKAKLKFIASSISKNHSSIIYTLQEESDEFPWAKMGLTALNIDASDKDLYKLDLVVNNIIVWETKMYKNNILICE